MQPTERPIKVMATVKRIRRDFMSDSLVVGLLRERASDLLGPNGSNDSYSTVEVCFERISTFSALVLMSISTRRLTA